MRIPLHAPSRRLILPGVQPDPVEEVSERTSGPPKHFSWSQMRTYIECSMRYYFQYVLGLRDKGSLPMALGNGLHSALEWNAKRKIATGADMPINDVRDLASDMLDIELFEVEGETDAAKGKGKDEAIGAVTLFRTKQAPKITPLVAEHRFLLNIEPDEQYPDPVRPVLGFIDVISEQPRITSVPGATPKMVTVEDYKWSSRRKSQGEVDTTNQIDLYDLVTYDQTGTVIDAIGLRQFGFTKDGPYSEPIYRSRELLPQATRLMRFERLKQKIRRVQDAIRKGIFIPTDNAQTCARCPYRQMCQFSLIKTDIRKPE